LEPINNKICNIYVESDIKQPIVGNVLFGLAERQATCIVEIQAIPLLFVQDHFVRFLFAA